MIIGSIMKLKSQCSEKWVELRISTVYSKCYLIKVFKMRSLIIVKILLLLSLMKFL
jgi:uncharacterized MAPEG superfamily protein